MSDPRTESYRQSAADDLSRILDSYPLPEMTGKRIFLTGATGFIGYWLLMAIARLNALGAGITVVALSRNPRRFLERHPEFGRTGWLDFVPGDVRDYPFPSGQFDLFIHGASDTSPEAAGRALELFETMVLGTRHVLRHVRASGARRILILSSGAVYGEQPAEMSHIPETAGYGCDSADPADAYGEGKRAMEMLAVCHGREYGIEPVIARCFAFIGYGLPSHLAVGQLIKGAMMDGRILIEGDGKVVRSYLYAADLAVWLLALACRGRAGTAYNVGSDEDFRLDLLAERICDTLGLDRRVKVLGQNQSMQRVRYIPDVSRIRQELRVEVWTEIETGIKRMAACL